MQQIKIRAWDSEFKKMIYEFHTEYYITADYGELKVARYDSNGDWVELEVMLFTGLQDKNGKEIYEGDIVKGKSEIMSDDGISFIEYSGHGFYVNAERFGWEGEGLWDWSDLEVIGNIHEHPHTLNPKGNE